MPGVLAAHSGSAGLQGVAGDWVSVREEGVWAALHEGVIVLLNFKPAMEDRQLGHGAARTRQRSVLQHHYLIILVL